MQSKQVVEGAPILPMQNKEDALAAARQQTGTWQSEHVESTTPAPRAKKQRVETPD